MKRLLNVLDSVIGIGSGQVAAWIAFVMMLLMITEVFARYLFHSPLLVSNELSGYMLVAITFIGLGYTWTRKGHVRITFVVERLPGKVRNWLRLANIIIAIAFTGILVRASYGLVQSSLRFGDRSEEWLRTPQAWPQLALIAGSVMLLLALVCDFIEAVKAARTTRGKAS
ncbi:MAG: TRAP transporter small permease [Chloroflexi bacterium]|nr:TRAP transporter small permease [Chloroflexota bacterium]